MQDEEIDAKQKVKELYRHDKMASQVLRIDRRLLSVQSDPLKDAEKSQPKSMKGRVSLTEMGSGLSNSKDNKTADGDALMLVEPTSIQLTRRTARRNISILDETTKLRYRPTTDATKEAYENIIQWVTALVGTDIPYSLILETVDTIICHFKEDFLKDSDADLAKRKTFITQELGLPIEPDIFQQLIRLLQDINDFGNSDDDEKEETIAVLASDEEESEISRDEEEEEDTQQRPDVKNNEPIKTETHDRHLTNSINRDETFQLARTMNMLPPISHMSVSSFQTFLANSTNLQERTELASITKRVLDVLEKHLRNPDLIEETLAKLFPGEALASVKYIIKNRDRIVWGLKLTSASTEEKQQILENMRINGMQALISEYEHQEEQSFRKRTSVIEEESESNKRMKNEETDKLRTIDLESLKFDQSSKLMTTSRVSLPEGSFKRIKPLYEEIHIPAPPTQSTDADLVAIETLPEWAQKTFPSTEIKHLNSIQSKVFPSAYYNDYNLLVCAPTGAGKTNIAMLTILRAISHHINPASSMPSLKQFKIIYIAPLKALVQEQVREFRRRLTGLGVTVDELTGDSNLTSHQISWTQVLVATPEKWDIITRKSNENSFIELVKLIIIDEVHLLHDQRGPVIESIVARSLWKTDPLQKPRIVALSATLPNYNDVAKFLRVPKEGLFYFDQSYRPCPLSQQFCAVREKASLKKANALNEVCFDKVLEAVSEGHQVIVFVHSRKDTARTAEWLQQRFTSTDNTNKITTSDAASQHILRTESDNVTDKSLKKLLPHCIGIHHAGLLRSDRSLAEDLFADGLLRVLVSTATLAWGVNLPAHTVIVKGTDVYSAETGTWQQLSPQDILQMLGRAGRPRYDTMGEGVIITGQDDLQYYLAVLNHQLPIESQFISNIIDNLNAEIVAGKVKTISDAMEWITFTYYYVRCLVSPDLYKVPKALYTTELTDFRKLLVHSILDILHNKGLIIYNPNDGFVKGTELGRIASYFYLKYNSAVYYNDELNADSSVIDIIRVFAMSDEFKYMNVRQDEKRELKELIQRAPIPTLDDTEDPLTKISILLQSYISQLKLESFAMNADMIFITQNAGRLLRAMLEIALQRKWAKTSKLLLYFSKAVNKRMWPSSSPLRQYKQCPLEVIRKMEASTLPWQEYLKLESPLEVGKAIRSEKYGKLVYDLLQRFPKLKVDCTIQPITASVLKFQLELTPSWVWNSDLHGYMEPFILLLEDTDGVNILYFETFFVSETSMEKPIYIDFAIQLTSEQQRNLPPNFFIKVMSEKWSNCESETAASFTNLILPKKFHSMTRIDTPEALPLDALENQEFEKMFQFDHFNKIQSASFHVVYGSDENALICAPKGSGKTVLAELAILNNWRQGKSSRVLYICPRLEKLNDSLKVWREKFENVVSAASINMLSDDLTTNISILSKSNIVLATPSQFEVLSRRWRKRKNIQRIALFIFDDMHELNNGLYGSLYELTISRILFFSTQLELSIRILGLSSCVANARDIGQWFGASSDSIFNFPPSERNYPINVHLQGFLKDQRSAFTPEMSKYALQAAETFQGNRTPILFLPSRLSCLEVAKFVQRKNLVKRQIPSSSDLSSQNIKEKDILKYLQYGVGIIHETMDQKDKQLIINAFETNILSLLLVTREMAYSAPVSCTGIILGTQFYDGKEMRYVDYPVHEINEMVGSIQSQVPNESCSVILLTDSKKKWYYRKFLSEPVPIESFLCDLVSDAIITEINNNTIRTKQNCLDWLAYTYFYRRLHANPSFYGLQDASPYSISLYLSELVEQTIKGFEQSSLISEAADTAEAEEDELIEPSSLSMIFSHYSVSYNTFQSYILALSRSSTMTEVIEIISFSSEFDDIPIREGELQKLLNLQKRLPLKFSANPNVHVLPFKVFLLLEAHFSRISLSSELKHDLDKILSKLLPLLNVMVDILSSSGYLNATTVMDLAQMVVQGMWDTESPLKQIPFFDDELLTMCTTKKIETVYDIMALEDDERIDILPKENEKLVSVANFVNNYPNVELQFSLSNNTIRINKKSQISVTLTKDDEPESLAVVSQHFPFTKTERWWIVLGNVSRRELYAIKRVTLNKIEQSYTLDFVMTNEGEHTLTIWAVCDSYLDADKEASFKIDVLPNDSSANQMQTDI